MVYFNKILGSPWYCINRRAAATVCFFSFILLSLQICTSSEAHISMCKELVRNSNDSCALLSGIQLAGQEAMSTN